jgi:hypothetical protein
MPRRIDAAAASLDGCLNLSLIGMVPFVDDDDSTRV